MRNFKIIQVDMKVVSEIVCDKCQKSFQPAIEAHWNEMGEPFSNFFEPFFRENFFSFTKAWGFGSRKDSDVHKADLCEDCYDEVFKDVKLQIKEY